MKKTSLLKSVLLLCALVVGSGSAWAQSEPVDLFHETFGDNSGSARTWSDTYSVKSGVSEVYSGISSYTVSNVKQGKNTTGSTKSGLNQSATGTDAYIIIGPLNVSAYESLSLTYQWKAASIKGTYTTSAYYATSASGAYTEVTGTGTGATTFVERSYSLPAAAQVSTLYLKIVWNTSNTNAIIDEVNLAGVALANIKITPSYNKTTFITPAKVDFSGISGLKAYVATAAASGSVTMTELDAAVPGDTPVLLIGTAGTEYTVPVVASATAPATNFLRKGNGTTDFDGTTFDYILYSDGMFYQIGSGKVATTKAYLHLDSDPAAHALDIIFDDNETTGVNEVKTQKAAGEYYNLAGQRVAQPTKGLYIVNGKKVIIK